MDTTELLGRKELMTTALNEAHLDRNISSRINKCRLSTTFLAKVALRFLALYIILSDVLINKTLNSGSRLDL